MTGRSLLPSTAGRILRCLLLLVVRADREVHAYPRCAIAHVGALHLHLQLTLHFRFHCLDRARLIGAPNLISERFHNASRFPLLGFVLTPLVGRRCALLPGACCPILCPPLGLDLSPLKGCHWILKSSARLALRFQVAPDVPRTSVGRAL